MGEQDDQQPIEGRYMDQCYGRELTIKEIRKLPRILKDEKKHFLKSVIMNTDLGVIAGIRLQADDGKTTYLITIQDGKFRVREETEAYKRHRLYGEPLPFKL